MLRFLHLKSKQPQDPTNTNNHQKKFALNRLPPRPQDPSPISSLPYEILENILTFAWHSEPGGIPGGGSFLFTSLNRSNGHAPTGTITEADDASDEEGHSSESSNGLHVDLPAYTLLPNPHTKLTTANDATRDNAGVFMPEKEFVRLSLVCQAWREIVRDLAWGFVSLNNLKRFKEFEALVGVGIPSLSTVEDQEAEEGKGKKSIGSIKGKELLAQSNKSNLCQTLHIDMPTGNLSIVPAWSSLPPLLLSIPHLTHLILTIAEPHPALFSVLSDLPEGVKTLDIHVSSPYEYKRPVIKGIGGGGGRLRHGVKGIKHLLINVLDPVFLECLLEGFGSIDTAAQAEGERASRAIYSSPSLQTLVIQGPHNLLSTHIVNTVSHSHSIRTLKLYPHSPNTSTMANGSSSSRISLPKDPLRLWNASKALSNEALFPALEVLVVQLPMFVDTTPVLEDLRAVCSRRRVRVDVEWVVG